MLCIALDAPHASGYTSQETVTQGCGGPGAWWPKPGDRGIACPPYISSQPPPSAHRQPTLPPEASSLSIPHSVPRYTPCQKVIHKRYLSVGTFSLSTVVQPYVSLCIVCVIFIGRFCLAGGIKPASVSYCQSYTQSVTDQVAPAQNPVLCRAGRCSRVPTPPPRPAASTTPPCLPVSAGPHRPV